MGSLLSPTRNHKKTQFISKGKRDG
jgi:hypothetical protein